MHTLKDYCLSLILNKDATKHIDPNKYQMVISAIAMNNHVDEIISYIFRSIEYQYINVKVVPQDHHILEILSPSYCVDRAYEYLLFLQNDHEYAHECESFAR